VIHRHGEAIFSESLDDFGETRGGQVSFFDFEVLWLLLQIVKSACHHLRHFLPRVFHQRRVSHPLFDPARMPGEKLRQPFYFLVSDERL
jgi:hypothetical protein